MDRLETRSLEAKLPRFHPSYSIILQQLFPLLYRDSLLLKEVTHLLLFEQQAEEEDSINGLYFIELFNIFLFNILYTIAKLIKVPGMGDSISEGTVQKWHKSK